MDKEGLNTRGEEGERAKERETERPSENFTMSNVSVQLCKAPVC